jgi:hypothetical protein
MARDQFRGDAAGVGPDPSLRGGLTRMSSLRGFKVADGDADIRGWEVRTLSGREIGEVDDLLIDERRGEVVMIDIDLKDSDEHVSMAIRGVQIDRSRHCVIVDSGDVRDARALLGGPDADRSIDDVDAGRTLYREGLPEDARTLDARDDFTEEVVIERRPIVEEVVVRRKIVDTGTDPDDVA